MSGAASDHRDVQHASGQVALSLHEGTVHDRNYPERRVQVSDLRLELSGLVKVPSIHVLRVGKEATAYLVREFDVDGIQPDAQIRTTAGPRHQPSST